MSKYKDHSAQTGVTRCAEPRTQNTSVNAHSSFEVYPRNRRTSCSSIWCDLDHNVREVNLEDQARLKHEQLAKDCLQSLTFPGMDFGFNDIDEAAEGTCNWLLEHETYK
jgi:hypothetical protein